MDEMNMNRRWTNQRGKPRVSTGTCAPKYPGKPLRDRFTVIAMMYQIQACYRYRYFKIIPLQNSNCLRNKLLVSYYWYGIPDGTWYPWRYGTWYPWWSLENNNMRDITWSAYEGYTVRLWKRVSPIQNGDLPHNLCETEIYKQKSLNKLEEHLSAC